MGTLEDAMAEYDDRIDNMLDDARGVHKTMAEMERDQEAAKRGLPGYVPATLDNPRPPAPPQRQNDYQLDNDADPYGLDAMDAQPQAQPQMQRGSAPRARSGPCSLVVQLPALPFTAVLEIVHLDEFGTASTIFSRMIKASRGPLRPLVLGNLSSGEYTARLLKPVGGAKAKLTAGRGVIDLRRR